MISDYCNMNDRDQCGLSLDRWEHDTLGLHNTIFVRQVMQFVPPEICYTYLPSPSLYSSQDLHGNALSPDSGDIACSFLAGFWK
jgi:hypothetical protein